jgi:hypothetical protein
MGTSKNIMQYKRNNTSSNMTAGRAYWAWGEYLNPLLDGNDALKELIHFLLGRRARGDLRHRKWMKPAIRYEKVWTWIQKYSRLVQNRSEVIVTRSCVTLRVRK